MYHFLNIIGTILMGNSIASSSTGSSIPLASLPHGGHAGRGSTTAKTKGNILGVSDPAREGIRDLKLALETLTWVHARESIMDDEYASSLSHSILHRLASKVSDNNNIQQHACRKKSHCCDSAARGLDAVDLRRVILLATTAHAEDSSTTLTGNVNDEELLEDGMSRLDEMESFQKALLHKKGECSR